MTVLLVTGSRKLPKAMEGLVRLHLRRAEPTVLIHGGAGGVDAFAARWAYDTGIEARSYPAKWREHATPWCRCRVASGHLPRVAGRGLPSICKAAGRRRNQQMLDEAKPDRVLAFPGPESVGTWDMIRRATGAGLSVHIVPLVDPPKGQ